MAPKKNMNVKKGLLKKGLLKKAKLGISCLSCTCSSASVIVHTSLKTILPGRNAANCLQRWQSLTHFPALPLD